MPKLKLLSQETTDIVIAVNTWSQMTLHQLEQVSDLISAKRIRKDAAAAHAAIRELTKNREDGIAIQNEAGKVKIKAEARIGAMTKALREAQGTAERRGAGRPKKGTKKLRHHGDAISSTPTVPTAEELGLHREDRKRFEAIAEAEQTGKLEEYFERCEEENEPVSTRGAAASLKAVSASKDYDGDEWYTPGEYIELAREVLGRIDLDPASNKHAQRTVRAKKFFTKDDDGLSKTWRGNVFLNPPYSTKLVRQFTAKLIEEYEDGNVKAAVLLVNNCTDAAWCQELLQRYPACFTAGRIGFEQTDGSVFSTRQGQIFFYLGRKKKTFRRVFSGVGTVVEVM